jgi:DNA-binding MarR family transcriptional regulator
MDEPCKEWTGARSPKGYGIRRYKGKTWRVHRAAWDEQVGPIPDGVQVLHHCDNPPCYQISHLYLGTAANNSRDMVERRRQALRGELPQTKLSADQAQEIRVRYAKGGMTQIQLAAEYGVTQGAISSLIRNREKTGKRRRTPAEVDAIRSGYAAGVSQSALASQFGLDQSSVSEIVRRKSHC